MKHRGFTLVELLIVIVVIGVLSAMMMLSSTEAVSSARAADIISDLRNIKTAVLAWYADNMDKFTNNCLIKNGEFGTGKDSPIQEITDSKLGLSKYMNGNVAINTKGDGNNIPKGEFCVFTAGKDNRDTWFIGYAFKDGEDKVREKLKARASSVGLHFTNQYPQSATGTQRVWMKIMGDWKPTE